jgi:hypothetical protein
MNSRPLHPASPARRVPPAPVAAAAARPARAAAPCSARASPTSVNENPLAQPDERLRALNAEQPDPKGGPREEVYCTKVGSTHPEEMYIVAGHMDGMGYGEAANDDASGTALVMELARILNAPGVTTGRSIRFALWNNEETGLNGATAYVSQRKDLQGIESPKGSGRYPEPRWLGMIQHDMMMFDHGMPVARTGADGKAVTSPPPGAAPRSRRQHRVPGEFAPGRRRAKAGLGFPRRQRQVRVRLSGRGRPAHDEHGLDPVHGPGAVDFAARERARPADRRRLEPALAPADRPGIHLQRQGLPAGLNAAQTTLAAIAQLAGAQVAK